MSDISLPLFRRSIPALADRRAEVGGIRALLAARNYTIDSISADVSKFAGIGADALVSHILSDYSRFALSSLESHLASGMSYYSPRAAAWPAVKLYYSAFYAAHAIQRAVGLGIVRIDGQLPSLITQLGRIYVSPSFSFSKGTYRYEIAGQGQEQMSITVTRLDDGAAIHATFWDHFRRFMEGVGVSVVRNQEPEAAQILGRIDEFTRLLHDRGGNSAGRLSEFRNAVNYRHEHSVWFPFLPRVSRDSTYKLPNPGNNSSVRLDFNASNQPIVAFRQAAHFISSVSYDLAELIIARSASRQHEFARHWARLKRDGSS